MIGAVDIGGTKIAVAAVLEHGEIVARDEWNTASFLAPQDASQRIAQSLKRFGTDAGQTLRGVGVGCTGPVDPLSGTVGQVELLPRWEGFPLAESLAERLALFVAVENDADAAALAEAAWGAGRNSSRFVYVTVSTGIGAGMVLDGNLYRGIGGAHPELGHQTLSLCGPPCYCGSTGCWESLASGPAMAKWMQSNAGPQDKLPENLSAKSVCTLAREGHPLALRTVDREAELLGVGLANLVTALCPGIIALGGGVMQSADLFLDKIRIVVSERCKLVPVEKVSIVSAMLGKDAPLLGAARVWQARFGESEEKSCCSK